MTGVSVSADTGRWRESARIYPGQGEAPAPRGT
jgi:hypothetical protein